MGIARVGEESENRRNGETLSEREKKKRGDTEEKKKHSEEKFALCLVVVDWRKLEKKRNEMKRKWHQLTRAKYYAKQSAKQNNKIHKKKCMKAKRNKKKWKPTAEIVSEEPNSEQVK